MVEGLEARTLCAGFSWSAAEVYLAELINRARSNPQAEGARLGINLTLGLSAGDASTFGSKEPLALNAMLTQSARAHAADMAARNFFDHVNPEGKNPSQRAQGLGYAGTSGENLGAEFGTINALYLAWMTNPTQRANILSLNQSFDSTYHYDHLGLGMVDGGPDSPYSDYYVADFGNPATAARKPALVGVVFNDGDHNNFYGIGEGSAGVRIDVATTAKPNKVLATYTTDEAGNYQITLSPGKYVVTYRVDDGSGRMYSQNVTIGSQNVRVAVKGSQLVGPDDHADAGKWLLATPIAIDAATGNGVCFGAIGRIGSKVADSDLMKFVAEESGPTTITALSSGGALALSLKMFSSAGLPLGNGASEELNSTISFNLVAGQTYYVLVRAQAAANTGAFAVLITGPGDEGEGENTESVIGEGQSVAGGFTMDNAATVAYLDSRGHPIFASRTAEGAWSPTDLFAAAGGPTLHGDLATFVGPKDGLVYVAGASDLGLMLYQRSADGLTWTIRNLSAELPNAKGIVSDLTVQIDAAKRVHILARTDDGSIGEFWQNGKSAAPGQPAFLYVNVRDDDLKRQMVLPAITGDLSAWITSSGNLQTAVLDESGNVLLLTRKRSGAGFKRWTITNVSLPTGAPALGGDLVGAFAGGRTTICGVDGAGNLWFIDQTKANGAFRASNITLGSAGPTLSAAGVSGCFDSTGGVCVFGQSAEGHVVSYRFSYQPKALVANWIATDVSAALPDSPSLVQEFDVDAKWIVGGGAMSITATTVDGLAVRFTFTNEQGWSFETINDKFIG